MPSQPLPSIALPAGQWTQVDWFAPGPFPYTQERTYCNVGGTGGLVSWRYYGPGGYLQGNFSECAIVTIVGTIYITVEMYSPTATTISRG